MKTVYAPDAQSVMDTVREMVIANPMIAFVVCVVFAALFATWATKHLF